MKLLIFAASALLTRVANANANDATVCAQDVKTCPDGSFVGRDSSNDCAFVPCPVPSSSPAANCLEDNWFLDGNKGVLVCSKKDIYLENVASTERLSCTQGEMIDVDLTATVVFNTERYDVGWYVALDGGDALNGQCQIKPLLEDDYPDGLLILDSPGSDAVVGQVQWNADHQGKNDKCGDVKLNVGGGRGVLDGMHLGNKKAKTPDGNTTFSMRLPCTDKTLNGNMDFAICFSWRESSNDNVCDPERLYPDHPSKCFCTRYDIPQINVNLPDGPVLDC